MRLPKIKLTFGYKLFTSLLFFLFLFVYQLFVNIDSVYADVCGGNQITENICQYNADPPRVSCNTVNDCLGGGLVGGFCGDITGAGCNVFDPFQSGGKTCRRGVIPSCEYWVGDAYNSPGNYCKAKLKECCEGDSCWPTPTPTPTPTPVPCNYDCSAWNSGTCGGTLPNSTVCTSDKKNQYNTCTSSVPGCNTYYINQVCAYDASCVATPTPTSTPTPIPDTTFPVCSSLTTNAPRLRNGDSFSMTALATDNVSVKRIDGVISSNTATPWSMVLLYSVSS